MQQNTNLKVLPTFILITLLFLSHFEIFAQSSDLDRISYSSPRKYELEDISISGIKYLDKSVLIQLSGLKKGEGIMVPGDKVTKAIEKLWKHGLFSDVKITATKIEGKKIWLDIYLQERQRLSSLIFVGIKNREAEDLQEKMTYLRRGGQVTDNVLNNARNTIKNHYIEKGYLNCSVNFIKKDDPNILNTIILRIVIDKKTKIKINDIIIEGNDVLEDRKIRRAMKETKKKRWYGLKRSKFIETNFEEDKKNIIKKYRKKGYRDAKIVLDSSYKFDEKTINLVMKIQEGKKYYFGNIKWVGNTKYQSQQLSKILKIKKGDVFDQEVLDNRLSIDQDAVSNLYLDDGYLFFNVNPVETTINNDTIDLEMRIFEGKQATIDKVRISGNTKTNDHVVRREIRTKPGELFSRSDIIRSVRELAQLGHFDPEKIVPTPVPNQAEGTVDLEYALEERANDQIEVSGGWGANMIVGTIGLRFSNFSTRNMFNKKAWRPLPTGDGQTLSLRAQTNGKRYQSYSISFIEPWLGGKKPNSLSVSIYHSLQSNGEPLHSDRRRSMKINGVSIGFGRRLEWPDDYFTLTHNLSLQNYTLDDWNYFIFSKGKSNNFSFTTTFSRNSIDNPLYTRSGSTFSLSLQLTPPYSMFKDSYWWKLSDNRMEEAKTRAANEGRKLEEVISDMEDSEKYRWIEYHKWTFKAAWYTRLVDDLVFHAKAQFGFLGYYNDKLGASPFERYTLGGDGMSGYSLYGRETIGLRGYSNNSLTPSKGANLYNKFTMEIRYPITLSQSATIYALAFLEGGQAWNKFNEYDPFGINRSAGVGLRIFLPMIGLMGIDWGYGFDEIPGRSKDDWGGQIHFMLGQQF